MSDAFRIVFFGDSICFGQGVSLHKGWVTRISAEVSALAADLGRDLLVVNASVNGNTTRQALERMPYDVQSHGVDVLLVQFGMNDCNYWQTDRGNARVSLPAFTANLAEIIARGRSFGARRVLVNTNHPTGRDREPMPSTTLTYEDSNQAYNEAIRAVVAAHDAETVRLNDVAAAFAQTTGDDRQALERLLLPDALHPSEEGHDLYFRTVEPAVRAAVSETMS